MAQATVSGLRVYLHTGNEHDEYLTVASARSLAAELEKAAKDVEAAAGDLYEQEERTLDEIKGLTPEGDAAPKTEVATPDDQQVSKTKAVAASGDSKKPAESRRRSEAAKKAAATRRRNAAKKAAK